MVYSPYLMAYSPNMAPKSALQSTKVYSLFV